MKITYDSTNSGGRWWLDDDAWKKLEEAGWDVDWNKGGRWLGAMAQSAAKDFPTIKDAIEEFEKVTGQEASDEGCNCCGPPHRFEDETGEAWSGARVLDVLYGENRPKTLREACRAAKGDE